MVAVQLEQLGLWGDPLVIKKVNRRADKPRLNVGRVLHLGAGVQSSCIAEMIVEGDLPPVDVVLFADTKNEPPWVYAQVEYLTQRLASVGIPLVVVQRSEGGLVNDCYFNIDARLVPMPLYTKDSSGNKGQVKRQCTSEYKIVPCDNYQLNWLVEEGHGKIVSITKGPQKGSVRRVVNTTVRVENIYGISWDEWDRGGKRGPKWQKAVYPLIDRRMTREDCEKWLTDHKLPVPLKSSCIVCPFHSDAFWKWLKTKHPAIFELACQFDEWLRSAAAKKRFKGMRQECYLHQSCQPLRSIDFDQQLALPIEERSICGDHCHT